MATRTVGPGKDYATIASAILACNDNPASRDAMDIVLVDPGTYNEMLDLQSLSGGWQIPCIIRGADPDNRPVITSTGAAQAVLGGGAYRGSAVGETTFEDLIFSGWTNASNGVIYLPGAVGCVIRRCKFVGNTGRMCIRWCGSTASRWGIIDSCEFLTSGTTGLGANGMIFAYGVNTVVKNNIAVCPNNVQFLYETISGPGVFEHNSIIANLNTGGTAAVYMVGSFRGNLIKNLGSTAAYGVYNSGGTNTENFINGTFTTRYTGTDGGGNLSDDPLFVNTGSGTEDLQLQETSPAIGSLSRSANTLLDFLGNSREDPTDAGAYMYITIAAEPWSEFGTDVYVKVSADFVINRNKNISGHWQKRSGLAADQNGANAVEQIPFALTVPGPASLRGRNKPYATTANPSAPNTPGAQGF